MAARASREVPDGRLPDSPQTTEAEGTSGLRFELAADSQRRRRPRRNIGGRQGRATKTRPEKNTANGLATTKDRQGSSLVRQASKREGRAGHDGHVLGRRHGKQKAQSPGWAL